MEEKARKRGMPPDIMEMEGMFETSETVFENDIVLVSKAYYYRPDKPSVRYYDIDIGVKDEAGDVNSFQTIISRQFVNGAT